MTDLLKDLPLIILQGLAVVTLVIVAHELGHLLVCRWLGVRVERFSVGFGKEIFGFNWKDIRWSICLIPLGGYVKPAGEEQEEFSGAPDEYFSQSWYGRIAIAFAGPFMNYFLAFVCFFALMFFWGEPFPSNEPIIGEMVSGYPAQTAGFKVGDKIIEIDGEKVRSWEDMARIIHSRPGKPIDIRFHREVEGTLEIKIAALVPQRDKDDKGKIGITPLTELRPHTFMKSLEIAYERCVSLTIMILKYIGGAFGRAFSTRSMPKIEVAGPIGIITIIVNAFQQGLYFVISLIAIISLNLGLFNLFPIPILDGGHIVQYLLEGIIRKPLNKNLVRASHIIGLTLLIAILIYATKQDISRIAAKFFQ